MPKVNHFPFRQISGDEAEAFRAWARENFVNGEEPKHFWHPMVREYLARLQEEEPTVGAARFRC
ncbi:MAG: hypothetical protein V3S64_10375 [bacterium]